MENLVNKIQRKKSNMILMGLGLGLCFLFLETAEFLKNIDWLSEIFLFFISAYCFWHVAEIYQTIHVKRILKSKLFYCITLINSILCISYPLFINGNYLVDKLGNWFCFISFFILLVGYEINFINFLYESNTKLRGTAPIPQNRLV